MDFNFEKTPGADCPLHKWFEQNPDPRTATVVFARAMRVIGMDKSIEQDLRASLLGDLGLMCDSIYEWTGMEPGA